MPQLTWKYEIIKSLKFLADEGTNLCFAHDNPTVNVDIDILNSTEGYKIIELKVIIMKSDLPVIEVVSASHILTDLTLNTAQPVYNYLTEE